MKDPYDGVIRNFVPWELKCECGCGAWVPVSTPLLMLDKLREEMEIPFNLNSSIRCEKHNERVGGASASDHLTGSAFDVSWKNWTWAQKFECYHVARSMGFNAIGLYDGFVHLGFNASKDFRIWEEKE